MAVAARSTSKSKEGGSSRAKIKGLGRFLFYSTITFVGLLNIQPWVAVAKQMKAAITFVPLLSSLTRVPFLGGCLLWLSSNEVSLSFLATGLWALTQYLEMADIEWIKKRRPIIYAWEFSIIFLHFPPYEGGYTALAEDFPYWSPDSVLWWNLVLSVITAFAFEFIYKILKK
ncbi:hypothetical protein [Allocoleopsis sp.]|uniref:hypothetical protein n=1 Tax=Allocoleopsis sp. TaxID=3088169 RepID=UPI002FD15040